MFVITILLHNEGDFVVHIESEILAIDASRTRVIPLFKDLNCGELGVVCLLRWVSFRLMTLRFHN